MGRSESTGQAARGGQEWFTTTHWSTVLAAGRTEAPRCAEALERLCRTYWYPLYAYVRRCGIDSHNAEDLTQEFLAGKCCTWKLPTPWPPRKKCRRKCAISGRRCADK